MQISMSEYFRDRKIIKLQMKQSHKRRLDINFVNKFLSEVYQIKCDTYLKINKQYTISETFYQTPFMNSQFKKYLLIINIVLLYETVSKTK